jgi:hypothetical protein
MSRILVCGGRNYGYTPESTYTKKDFPAFSMAMSIVVSHEPTLIIDGCAKGGDEVGKLVAASLSLEHLRFPADWLKYGKAAGHIRNKRMLEEGKPDLVIAFKGGKGTENMISIAKKAGVEVVEYE